MSLIRLGKSITQHTKQWLLERLYSTGVLPTFDASVVVNRPIMSADDIVALADELAQLTQSLTPNPKPSEALRQGEQTSRFMGAGLEYEESRPYQLGDEIRRINWRLMAKTGQAYTKLFQEERQESWFILVDHRQSMRFGTRTRLKATQAARVAGYFAWLAQQGSIPIAGGRLAESLQVTPIFEGRGSYAHLMETFCQSCPPLSRTLEPHIDDVLVQLTQQIQPGSRVILIGDFHDATARTTEILTALQEVAMVTAVMIRDRVEFELPQVDGLQLQAISGGQGILIGNEAQRADYQAWSKQFHQKLQDHLQQAGVKVCSVWADDSISVLNALNASSVDRGVAYAK